MEQPGVDIRLEVTTDPQLLCAIRGVVRGYLVRSGLPEDQLDDVVLAVDEACTNTIRHAYGGQTDAGYVLTLDVKDGVMEVVLRDEGQAAQPDRVVCRDDEAPTKSSLRPGGLGLALMRRVASYPSRPGSCMSIRIRSGRWVSAAVTPASPVTASITS